METILTTLAICGAVMIVIGRVLIVRRAHHIGKGWAMALSTLPLAELMFLTRYWEEAKAGAFVSLFGLAMVMPWSGQMLWNAQRPATQAHLRSGTKTDLCLAGPDGKPISEPEMMKMKMESAEVRLEAMNARLLGWYKDIQERRDALKGNEVEVVAFNTEAKAYHEFFAVVREETHTLDRLKGKEPSRRNDDLLILKGNWGK